MGAGAAGMHHTLRNPLPVEVGDFFKKLVVLQCVAYRTQVLIIRNGMSLPGGQYIGPFLLSAVSVGGGTIGLAIAMLFVAHMPDFRRLKMGLRNRQPVSVQRCSKEWPTKVVEFVAGM